MSSKEDSTPIESDASDATSMKSDASAEVGVKRRRKSTASRISAASGAIEVLKNVVEIAAIFVTGWWAYTHYFSGEAPSLEPRAKLATSLIWSGVSPGPCVAKMRVSVKNIGKTSFDLSTLTLEVWLTTYVPPAAGAVTRFDPEAIMKAPSTFTDTLSTGSLVGHYAPDVELIDDYHFVVPALEQNADQSEQLAVFRFVASGVGGEGENLQLTDWRWTGRCETQPSETQAQIEQSAP